MVRKKMFALFSILLLLVSNLNAVKLGNFLKNSRATPDPDTYLTPPKIIRRHGYPAEAHIIQSEDGYLLEYHRIPHGKVGPKSRKPYPVLLHHGILSSSLDWIVNGPEKSLGYLLANEGYDVWIANARGNTHSRSHISLSPEDKEFWNFSFHEMGFYDIPAAVDYILNVTNSKKLIHIGHSLGTTIFYVFSSTRPEYNSKILVHISVAPVAELTHTTSAYRLLVPYAKTIMSMYDWYSKGAFLEYDVMSQLLTKFLCGKSIFRYNICEQLIIFTLCGKDEEQFNKAIQPLITSHMPAGTSSKNMIHASQLISSGNFSNYDYGSAENIRKYGTASPPAYNFSKISVPIKFFYGRNDILACPTDVKLLYQKLPKPMGCTAIDYDKWNHVDFLWAIDVNKLFNNRLLQFVKNVTDTSDFMANTVERALNKRAREPVPVNEPFEETSFLNNNFNGISSLSNLNMTDSLLIFPEANAIVHYPHMVKAKVDDNTKDVKKVFMCRRNGKCKPSTRNYAEGRKEYSRRNGETANTIKKYVQITLTQTKDFVENSAKDIRLKMKDTIFET